MALSNSLASPAGPNPAVQQLHSTDCYAYRQATKGKYHPGFTHCFVKKKKKSAIPQKLCCPDFQGDGTLRVVPEIPEIEI